MSSVRPGVAASVSYDRIAAQYEQARGGVERARQLAVVVLRWLPAGSLVCDVGAGTGVVGVQLRDAGVRVFGVDISAKMLAQARERLPGRIAVADAAALPVADVSLDALTYVWVMHHVGDLPAALREARRVLRPGGLAVCVDGLALPREDEADRVVAGLRRALRHRKATVSGKPVADGAVVDSAVPAGGAVAVSSAVVAAGAGVDGTVIDSAVVAEAAVAAGLEVAARDVAVIEFGTSPAGLADALEQRLFNYVWDVDDATWAAVVQPAVDTLRRLPDAARVRRVQSHHPLCVLRRPAA